MTDDEHSPWVGPPEDDEFWWAVEARTSKDRHLSWWPAVGKHPAGAKKEFAAGLPPEITVEEWGRVRRDRSGPRNSFTLPASAAYQEGGKE